MNEETGPQSHHGRSEAAAMARLDRRLVRPNELSLPGERAARGRAEAIFRRLDELGSLRGQALVIPSPDPVERELALARLERLADLHGRGSLLDQALAAVRDALLAREASPGISGPYGVDVRGTHRIEDEVAMLVAIEDAVAVAITEDLLDHADAIALSTPGRRMLGMPELERAAAGAGTTGRPAAGDGGVTPDGTSAVAGDEASDEPAVAGDETADDVADRELAASERRGRRAAVFVVIAALAIPAALSMGAAWTLPALVVIVAAAGLLAWLFG